LSRQWQSTKVALKSLTGNQTEEFYKEAAVMRELRHPNIVSIFGNNLFIYLLFVFLFFILNFIYSPLFVFV
jgi:hypothetical protein